MQNISTSSKKSISSPVGRVVKNKLIDDQGQEYFLYLPRTGHKARPIFVTVHGLKRMAELHAITFTRFADQYGAVLVAPIFPKDRFPDYQQLGFTGNGARADLVLNRIIDEVVFLTGAESKELFMFGYSGGGQFVHRYAMLHPRKPKRIALAAPGWYTFPDYAVSFPRGIKKVKGQRDVAFDAAGFLSIPTCVMVGDRDVHRDAALNTSKAIDQQQGANRLERGRAWVSNMKTAARYHRVETEIDFQILPGARHSFLQSMRKSQLGERVFNFLFEAR